MSKRNTRVSFNKPGSSTTTTCPGTSGSRLCVSSKKKLNLPALSIPPKTPPLDPALERLKKKTIRRNAPKGEDLKKIKEVIKTINKEVVTVQEFVGLVSPYTGDNGNVLRAVMGDDLSMFRRMAKRVYDTMTQDVSDVLANEQIHLTDHYNEKYTLFMDKMMRSIDEIYKYIPHFNFEQYYTDPDYLAKIYPIEREVSTDPEEREMQKRQEAYHRLQWLRSEGVRLREENDKLQVRLKELKNHQKEDLEAAREMEENAEERKNQLEATQACLQNQLGELNESMEKSIICTEEELRLEEDAKLAEKAIASHMAKAKAKKRQEAWNVKTARQLETESFRAAADSAVSSVSIGSTSSATGAVKKRVRPKIKKPKLPPEEAFHYSPPRSPPTSDRNGSPFHYSPPKSPPAASSTVRSPGPGAKAAKADCNECLEGREQAAQASRARQFARRNLAPRDTWSGFM